MDSDSQHALVCGLGNIGYRVVLLLRRLGIPVTVLTSEATNEWLRKVKECGAQVELGDARNVELLERAHLGRARSLLATTDSDLTNLEIALDTRREHSDLPIVLRIFDQHLGAALEETLGACRAFGAAATAAPKLAWASLAHDILGSFELGGSEFVVQGVPNQELSVSLRREYLARHASELEVDPGRQPRGPRLSQIFWGAPRALRRLLALLVLLTLLSIVVFGWGMKLDPIDALYFVITTVTTTGYGDITPRASAAWLKIYACLLMLGGSAGMALLFSFITDWVVNQRVLAALGQAASDLKHHVIVVGLGHVGYRVVNELEELGVPVLALEIDGNSPFVASLKRGSRVLVGDGRLAETMRAAGLHRARAVVAATGDDATNLSIVLSARHTAPNIRSVVRVFDADLAEKIQAGGWAGVAYSTSRIAAPMFAACSLCCDVVSAFVDSQGLVALQLVRSANPTSAQVMTVKDETGREHQLAVVRWPFVGA